jgi:hypothetical protein
MEIRTFRHSRTTNRLSIVLFVGLFLLSQIGFWQSVRASDGGGIAICAVMGVMFAGLAVMGLRLSSSRPYLSLSSEGIELAHLGLPLIPWSDVKALYRRDLMTHSVVEIVLRHTDKYERLAPRWRLSRIALERTPEGPAVCVLITSLDAPPDRVVEAMQQAFQDFVSKSSNTRIGCNDRDPSSPALTPSPRRRPSRPRR